MVMITLYPKQKKRYRTDFWTLWEKARVGCFKRTASKHAYYLWWNTSPAQVGCMRQALGPCALGRPRGITGRGRWDGGSGWGIHVNPWLIHVNVWEKPLQYYKVISLQRINEKKNKMKCCLSFRCITKWFRFTYTYSLIFRFFSHTDYYRLLGRVHCVIQ